MCHADAVREAERLGCLAYLRKPCEADTILTLLDALVDDDSYAIEACRAVVTGCRR